VRIGVKPGQWGWRWDELVAGWRAAEECGFDLVSCFDHVTAAPGAQQAWDAPSLAPPPVIVGGKSEAAMAVAARAADGWNANESDPDAYARLARRMDELCAATGRNVARTVQFFDRALGPDVRERLARFEEAGATTVTFVLSEDTGPDTVKRLAEAVLDSG
jgi:alkanesulfonate monooxygenase SsuD/methylene tetrahydromethanopterin reductase-like flavin-dependent oxidoreductase (luciferase family)